MKPVTRSFERFGRRGYVVGTFFTYQIAIGCSLRWFDRSPHVRIYLGPFKLALGLTR